MLGRDNHVGRAEQGVGTGGIDGQRVALGGLEINLRTSRAADPVALLYLDTLDEIHIVQIVNQALRILGNRQHPLALGFMDNLTAAALAHAVDHFFVSQHALTGGTPVDTHFLLIGKALFEQLQENPLGPLVVIRVGRVDLARPVKRQAERLELTLKACDVLLGHFRRMDVVLDGKVLGRQAERIPSHRVQHVIALHTLFTRHNVKRSIGARMAYMQALTGRIREFDQRIKLFLFAAVFRLEAMCLIPDVLPLLFNQFVIVLQRYFPLK